MIAPVHSAFQDRAEIGHATIFDHRLGTGTGHAILACTRLDPFGNRRCIPQHVLALVTDATASTDHLDMMPLPALLDANMIDVFYLDAPDLAPARRQPLYGMLTADRRWTVDDWPCMSHPRLEDGRPIARFVRAGAGGTQASAVSSRDVGARTIIPFNTETQHLISRLQSAVEEIAAVVMGTEPGRALGALRIMNVGSTSRGTYTSLPVDFDLVIQTESDQKHLDHGIARSVCRSIGEAVERTPAFQTYWRSMAASRTVSFDDVPRVELDWFGVRGKQSLVGRLDVVAPESAARRRVPFLDITFGQLPQLVGYEIWMQRTFERLGSVAADRLRSEIRLAKSTLKQVGKIYGSDNRGLRAHAVEQLVIQCHNYRASGGTVGTFENSMRLIAEEGCCGADGKVVPFDRFKQAFPLWHPGWWEYEAGFVPYEHNVDLWSFLGDGEPVAAAERWRDLVDFADRFCARLPRAR